MKTSTPTHHPFVPTSTPRVGSSSIVNAAVQPEFFSADNLRDMSVLLAPFILIAMAQSMVMVLAGVDLAVGAMVSLSSVVLARSLGHGSADLLTIAVIVMGCGILGAITGLVVSRLGLPALVVTLATSFIWTGLALTVLPQPGGSIPDGVAVWVTGVYSGVPMSAVICVVVFLAWTQLRKSTVGLRIFAVGGSGRAAEMSGLSPLKAHAWAFGAAALLAGIAGLVLSAQTGSGDAAIGTPFTLASLTAAVIGGVSLFGGQGRMLGAVAGAVVIALISNILIYVGVSSFYQFHRTGRAPAGNRHIRGMATPGSGTTCLRARSVTPMTAETTTRYDVPAPTIRVRAAHSRVTLGVVAACVLFYITTMFVVPEFATLHHLSSTLNLASILGIVAIGSGIVIINGGIDLSVANVITAAGVLASSLTAAGWPLLAIILTVLMMGALVGLVNGTIVAGLWVPPLIVTLAVGGIVRGIQLVATGGTPQAAAPPVLQRIANDKIIFGLTASTLIWLALTIALTVTLIRTRLGRTSLRPGQMPAQPNWQGSLFTGRRSPHMCCPVRPLRQPACCSLATPESARQQSAMAISCLRLPQSCWAVSPSSVAGGARSRLRPG